MNGAILGAGTAVLASVFPISSVVSFGAMMGVGTDSGALGNLFEESSDHSKGSSYSKYSEDMVLSSAAAKFPWKMIGFKGKGIKSEIMFCYYLFTKLTNFFYFRIMLQKFVVN